MKTITKNVDKIIIRISNIGFVLIIIFSHISKLFGLLTKSENKKSIHSKDEINTNVDAEIYLAPLYI